MFTSEEIDVLNRAWWRFCFYVKKKLFPAFEGNEEAFGSVQRVLEELRQVYFVPDAEKAGRIVLDYEQEPWAYSGFKGEAGYKAEYAKWLVRMDTALSGFAKTAEKLPEEVQKLLKRCRKLVDETLSDEGADEEKSAVRDDSFSNLLDRLTDPETLAQIPDPVLRKRLGKFTDEFRYRPAAYRVFGSFRYKPERITVFVRNILVENGRDPEDRDAIHNGGRVEKAFEKAVAHELFHALHAHLAQLYGAGWPAWKCAEIVRETLAESFDALSGAVNRKALEKELARYRIDACPKTGTVGLLGAAERGEETLADAVVSVLSEALVDWKEAEHGIRGLYEAWKLRKA